jgi:hypothetical protein
MTDQTAGVVEQAAQLLATMHVDQYSSGEDEARALDVAGLLADPEQAADLKRAREQRDGVVTEIGTLRDELHAALNERDLLLWLHAEAAWWSAQYQRDVVLVWKPERDQLQARIDEVLAELDTYRSWQSSPDLAHQIDYPGILDAIRAVLQGDQPAEVPGG